MPRPDSPSAASTVSNRSGRETPTGTLSSTGATPSRSQNRSPSRQDNISNSSSSSLTTSPSGIPAASQLSNSLGGDKSVRKKASYGALLAASTHHNAVFGTSVGSNSSGSAPASRRGSAVNQFTSSNGNLSYGTSLPRAIPGAAGASTSAVGSYRRPLATGDEPGTSYSASFKKSFSPGRSFGSGFARHNTPSPAVDSIGEREAARLVSEHLVDASDREDSNDGSPPKSFGSVSHNLLGGATTRDIYQWKEKRLQPEQGRRRRNSESDISGSLRRTPNSPPQISNNPACRQANIITRNFIDFLLIYGYYGGDVLPEEYYEDDEDDEERIAAGGVPGDGEERNREASGNDETAPLLNGQRAARPGTATPVHGTSAKKAFFMLMKAFVGTGVLFLPKAFSNGGMGFSIVLLVVIGWLTLHCMLLLVETSRTLGGSFGDIGEKLYGPGVRQLVLWSIAVSQKLILILQLAIYVPLSWVRRIKHFSIPSLIADVFILMGLAYIFYHDLVVLGTEGVGPNITWVNLQSFSLFIGTAMFAFEGICLILPIAESMKHPEHFGSVLTWCVVTIGVIFVVIGATGYLAFGDKVETVVFLNLPKGSPLVMGLQFFYAIAIMLSFPLTVYPSIRIIEAGLFGVRDGKMSSVVKWQKNAFRAVFVSMLAFVAWAGSNNLDKFVSLVGCLACVPLSFIYPALFHYHIAKNPWVKAKDIAIVIFGIIALVYTTYVTIEQWVVSAPDVPAGRCSISNVPP
ncbi:transmembrane amino acid transporter protein-domain-containing protein [Chytridium lagenaria]|nr:transmembrane amino acid transporter protein-domain-containing protein [Chytridium lagenaria]